MEKLPQNVWLERCERRIAEVEGGIGTDDVRRLARAIRAFERTGAMPPEAAVDFVLQEMARSEHGRFERRSTPRN